MSGNKGSLRWGYTRTAREEVRGLKDLAWCGERPGLSGDILGTWKVEDVSGGFRRLSQPIDPGSEPD